MTLTEALIGLFSSAFISSTLFPGASEAAYLAVLHYFPDRLLEATLVAGTANTLGSMSSYILGRVFPNRVQARAMGYLKRYGSALLLLAWLPVIGDTLPVAAGWLRVNWLSALILIAIGKFTRYLLLAGGYAYFC